MAAARERGAGAGGQEGRGHVDRRRTRRRDRRRRRSPGRQAADPERGGGRPEGVQEQRQFPINHTVVIKDELLAKYPDLAADVFNTFAESKRLYVEKLKKGEIEKTTDADK